MINSEIKKEIIDTTKPIPSQITDNIFLASSSASKDEKYLLELGIKDILVVGKTLAINFPDV